MGTGATFATASFGASFIAGAVGAAAGSIVSQGVGMAMGMQDSFSWSQVGLAALGGGLTAGFGSTTFGSTFSSDATIGAIQRAAASNMATQGIVYGINKVPQPEFKARPKFSSTLALGKVLSVFSGLSFVLEGYETYRYFNDHPNRTLNDYMYEKTMNAKGIQVVYPPTEI